MNIISGWNKKVWLWIAGSAIFLLLIIAAATGDPDSETLGQKPVATPPTSTTAVNTAVIPQDLAGKSVENARAALLDLGFRDLIVAFPAEQWHTVKPSWEVAAVDSAGSAVPLSTQVILRVKEPQPTIITPAPLSTTTSVAPAVIPTVTPTVMPPPAPVVTRDDPPAPSSTPSYKHFANCTEARAAGAAPLYRGEPGYRSALDRDDDGVACEK